MNEIENNHKLELINRKQLKLDGVLDVGIFNEEEVKCKTTCGNLLIKGRNLHIEVLDLSSQNLEITGEIQALVYSVSSTQKGMLKRLFS